MGTLGVPGIIDPYVPVACVSKQEFDSIHYRKRFVKFPNLSFSNLTSSWLQIYLSNRTQTSFGQFLARVPFEPVKKSLRQMDPYCFTSLTHQHFTYHLPFEGCLASKPKKVLRKASKSIWDS